MPRDADAGPRAVYEALRNGNYAEVAWEDIGEADRQKIRDAFWAGMAAQDLVT